MDTDNKAEKSRVERLNAAAPDLLRACELFAAYDSGDSHDGVALMLAYAEAIASTRTAITKATQEA